ncbi:Wadjet anti-phage system protein JetD domain-containing protein [Hymenobacter gummosus]|nr:DUF3322 and DUF2220 domain-containing protein [Hymenobacter gummosus]
MITPAEITAKAQRQYARLLRAWLTGTLAEQFPLVIPGNKGSLSTEPTLRIQQLAALRAGSREGRGFGYTVEWQTVRSRYGEQGMPVRIQVGSQEDYLRLCGLAADFSTFRRAATLIRQQQPGLEGWLHEQVLQVTKYADCWPELLRVCAFFQQHPLPEVYARQVSGVPSKFVETNMGILGSMLSYLLPAEHQRPGSDFATRFGLRTDAPTVRFRLLDAGLAAHYGGLRDLAIPRPDFEQLRLPAGQDVQVLIVENRLTFLTLLPLARTIAIWGSGYDVERLRHCAWLADVPIWYWGDIDLHGFHILAQLRTYFPQVRSVLMDEGTYRQHRQYAHAGSIPTQQSPAGLTAAEQRIFQLLAATPERNRLEQEHITAEYADGVLTAKLS